MGKEMFLKAYCKDFQLFGKGEGEGQSYDRACGYPEIRCPTTPLAVYKSRGVREKIRNKNQPTEDSRRKDNAGRLSKLRGVRILDPESEQRRA